MEKRRECKEVRNAYGTLRGDYDQLKAELESAELQCQRLKQVCPSPPAPPELQRERKLQKQPHRSLEAVLIWRLTAS